MTVYMTKTWGFGSPSAPLQFSLSGWRDRAREILRPGDLVVIVGTMGAETNPDERGKILGLMEPTIEVVSSLDYGLGGGRPQDFNDDGQYRWPYGLELRKAWIFREPRTAFADISDRRFNMDSAQGIVPLTEKEAERILALPHDPIALLQPIQSAARVFGADEARRRGAPPPTTRRTGVMHMRRAPAYTYAMEVTGSPRPAFKIGWAFDYKTRERTFNLVALPQLTGVRYTSKLTQLWPTAVDAFRMEQDLLSKFDSLRHATNREVVVPLSLKDLQEHWLSYLIQRRTART